MHARPVAWPRLLLSRWILDCIAPVPMVRRVPIAALTVFLLSAPYLGAQQRHGWGYVFVAPGTFAGGDASATLHFGGGGERLLASGLGLGGEAGYVGRTRDFGSGSGILSLSLGYHAYGRAEGRRLVPFAAGGLSVAFRNGSAGGAHFGGGVQYWLGQHAAVRIEARDHIFSSDSPHLFEVRLGLAFR